MSELAPQAERARWINYLRRGWSLLLSPRTSLPIYAVCLVPLMLIPSAMLAGTAYGVLVLAGIPTAPYQRPPVESTLSALFGTIVFAPVVETLLLALMIRMLSAFSDRPIVICSVSAFVWALMHGLVGAISFFGSIWSFFVFSAAFLAWRKTSFRHGFMAAAVPHFLANSLAMASIWLWS